MNKSLTVFLADEKLKEAAKSIIDITRKMTGDASTDVIVEIDTLGGGTGTNGYSGNLNWASYPNNVLYTGVTTGTSNVSVQSTPSNWTTATTTGMMPPNAGGNYYIQTPATTITPSWTVYSAPVTTPMTPDQVPSSDLFEKMLMASIKQLNEAYNLGRVHGYIEGKKHGGDEVMGGLDAALDHDPLTYAEDPSPDAATSSPTV